MVNLLFWLLYDPRKRGGVAPVHLLHSKTGEDPSFKGMACRPKIAKVMWVI